MYIPCRDNWDKSTCLKIPHSCDSFSPNPVPGLQSADAEICPMWSSGTGHNVFLTILRYNYLILLMKMLTSARIPVLVLILLIISACAKYSDGTWKAPLVYRIDIQQGNVVDQGMINKLQPGMDKKQVQFIMGTPLITDPFHSDRWDYVYSMEPGKGEREQRRITLYFKNEKLAYVDGDVKVNAFPSANTEEKKEQVVDVPLEENKEGFFNRMFNREKPSAQPGEETADQETETALANEPSEETGKDIDSDVTEESSELPEVSAKTTPSTTPDKETPTTTTAGSTTEPEQNKNLLKRFWDRMTSGASDSTIEQGEESERDRRDAEVLESAGGEL